MASLMKQTTVRTYATSDGQTFQNKIEAVSHEIGLKAQNGRFSDMAELLSTVLTSEETRREARGQLEVLVKLSNMLDHKPRAGGRKKGSGAGAAKKRKAEEATA